MFPSNSTDPADFDLDDARAEALAALRRDLHSENPNVVFRAAREIMRTYCTHVRHRQTARLGPRRTIIVHVHNTPPVTRPAMEDGKSTPGG